MTPFVLRVGLPALTLLLSGCVGGLLGGGKPDQLYRFGTTDAAAPVAVLPETARRTLSMPMPTFPPEVSADRMLTSQGRELAYVKDARWVTSAPALYQMAVEASMRSRAAVTFVDRSQARSADGELRIAIDRFEAVYDADPMMAPTIHIEGRAILLISDDAPPSMHRVHGEQRARVNTASGLAAAFDAAVAQSTNDLTGWISVSLPKRAKMSASR